MNCAWCNTEKLLNGVLYLWQVNRRMNRWALELESPASNENENLLKRKSNENPILHFNLNCASIIMRALIKKNFVKIILQFSFLHLHLHFYVGSLILRFWWKLNVKSPIPCSFSIWQGQHSVSVKILQQVKHYLLFFILAHMCVQLCIVKLLNWFSFSFNSLI